MTREPGAGSEVAMLPGAVRVLVVDDDVQICAQVAASLATSGYQVVTANDATGRPEASASMTTLPKVSDRLGNRNRSAEA